MAEETGVPGETDLPQVIDRTFSHNVVHIAMTAGFELATLVMIGTDCTGSFHLPYDHDHGGPIHPYANTIWTTLVNVSWASD